MMHVKQILYRLIDLFMIVAASTIASAAASRTSYPASRRRVPRQIGGENSKGQSNIVGDKGTHR